MPKVKIGIVASPTPGNAEAFARKHDPELGRGRLVHPAEGKTSVTVTTRVTDNRGKTGSASRTFAITRSATDSS